VLVFTSTIEIADFNCDVFYVLRHARHTLSICLKLNTTVAFLTLYDYKASWACNGNANDFVFYFYYSNSLSYLLKT
jgi:hypothetical protein